MDEQIDTSLTPKKRFSKKQKQKVFLEAYAQHANILLSAREAGVSRQAVYQWLEHDEDFSIAYNQAKEDAKDVLRAEIYRRAVLGWDEPVFQVGKLAGVVRKYDATLLMFHSVNLIIKWAESLQFRGRQNKQ